MTVVVSATFRLRRGTAAAWTAANPVLALGEPGVETDTRKLKFGDGATAWSALQYLEGAAAAVAWADIAGKPAALTTWGGVARASGFDTFAAAPTSANLLALLTTKTGTGNAVFSASPTFTGTITASRINCSSAVDAAGLRATGVALPSTGAGIEFIYTGGVGYLSSYDRGNNLLKQLNINALIYVIQNHAALKVAADDAAAAAAGAILGELYVDAASNLKVRRA